jgi:divalent metal cation (Fe/Co/Zn/Cd) transporter
MDIHVQFDGTMSVTKSNEIAHRVKDRLDQITMLLFF